MNLRLWDGANLKFSGECTERKEGHKTSGGRMENCLIWRTRNVSGEEGQKDKVLQSLCLLQQIIAKKFGWLSVDKALFFPVPVGGTSRNACHFLLLLFPSEALNSQCDFLKSNLAHRLFTHSFLSLPIPPWVIWAWSSKIIWNQHAIFNVNICMKYEQTTTNS